MKIFSFFSADNTWSLLDCDGDFPGSLQEHTMVGYRDSLYVFGGEVGFSNGVETPLWMYSISVNNTITKNETILKIKILPRGTRGILELKYTDVT